MSQSGIAHVADQWSRHRRRTQLRTMHYQNCCSRSRHGPHLVVLQQVGINEHPKRLRKVKRRHSANCEVNLSRVFGCVSKDATELSQILARDVDVLARGKLQNDAIDRGHHHPRQLGPRYRRLAIHRIGD